MEIQASGAWAEVPATAAGGFLEAQVKHFSYFVPTAGAWPPTYTEAFIVGYSDSDFDTNCVVTASSQSYLWFGSLQPDSLTVGDGSSQDAYATQADGVSVSANEANVIGDCGTGTAESSRRDACLWSSGDLQGQVLAPYSSANGVFATASTLYVGGQYGTSEAPSSSAAVWAVANGLTQRVDLGYPEARGTAVGAVFADDVSVYAAGCDIGQCGWWTIDRTRLTSTFTAIAGNLERPSAIFVAGGHVYLAGVCGKNPWSSCLWVDGALVSLPAPYADAGAIATSVTVADGHVYVGGYATVSASAQACYWIAGVDNPGGATVVTLEADVGDATNSGVTSIAALNGVAYAAGWYRDRNATTLSGCTRSTLWYSDGTQVYRRILEGGNRATSVVTLMPQALIPYVP